MERIQIRLESELLRAVDEAARRARLSRSALVRIALREHLKQLKLKELEAREHRGYDRWPDDPADAADWARVAAWPER